MRGKEKVTRYWKLGWKGQNYQRQMIQKRYLKLSTIILIRFQQAEKFLLNEHEANDQKNATDEGVTKVAS